MITDIYLVQIYGVVNVCPHVVVIFDMMVEPLPPTFKLVTGQTTDETESLLILLCAELKKGEKCVVSF